MLTTVKCAVLRRPRTSRSSLVILVKRFIATQKEQTENEADVVTSQLRTPKIDVNDPAIKLRVGTVQLPPELQKRIYAVLHGNYFVFIRFLIIIDYRIKTILGHG